MVLKTADYKESDKMLTLLCPEKGKMSALSRGSKKAGSILRAGTQPFTVADFYLNKRADKYYVTHCDVVDSFYSLSKDVTSFAFASFVADICLNVSVEGPSERLFSLAVNSLYSAKKEGADIYKLFLYFLIKITDILGYRPSLNFCAVCGGKGNTFFSAASGGVVCEKCKGEIKDLVKISPEILTVICEVLSTPPKHMEEIIIKEEVRAKLKLIFCNYLESILDFTPKSMKFLLSIIK
ncbi:MAG: DNA repair protein RecO [Eubacteriales bacterium]